MNDENKKAPTLLDVTKSVMWAMLGVQKSANYERDFTHGKPWQYIVIGLIAVALFIGTLITVVRIVMKMAGV
jgi:ElaB/YqjD/DUF883 family membrane-anchored ribosome-binding protein